MYGEDQLETKQRELPPEFQFDTVSHRSDETNCVFLFHPSHGISINLQSYKVT